MKTSPTQRSLKLLRDRGYLVAVVEKWNPAIHIRQDLWGFGDLLAIKGDDCLIVQTTSGANVASRLAKIRAASMAALWLVSPHRRIVVHGWRRGGARGKRKLWECREEFVEPTL
jgi:hypothetical protein